MFMVTNRLHNHNLRNILIQNESHTIFLKRFFIFLFIVMFSCVIHGQKPISKPLNTDSTEIVKDSISILALDSIPPERTLETQPRQDVRVVETPISPEALDKDISYSAMDSMIFDAKTGKVLLYDRATMQYDQMNLEANYVEFSQEDNLVIAEGYPDSLGRMAGFPNFSDGDQNFTAKRMKYNFKTEKGVVYQARSQQNDLYVVAEKTAFERSGTDSTEQNIIYGENSLFTTCDHEEPHYGIRSKKQKIITDKLIVVGPSNIEIGKIPTPLWLPFGFFPITKGQRSGILFPRDYESHDTWGFGLRNIGYYWGINDHMDLQVTGNLYTRGTFGINSQMRYATRYKYSGSLRAEYSRINNGEPDGSLEKSISNTFKIQWDHRQDQKAHPTRTIGGSVNFSIGNHDQFTNTDAFNVLRNNIYSNISISKRFPGRPISLTAGMNVDQNTNTRQIKLTLPDVKFKMNRIYPFEKDVRTGKKKWYEEIGIDYSADALARMTATDTTFFTTETLDNIQYGFRHKTNVGSSWRVFKNFNINPSFNYQEIWLPETIIKEYVTTIDTTITDIINPIDSTVVRQDTTFTSMSDDVILDERNLRALRSMSFSVNISTDVFATLLFKNPKSRLRGLRYTMKPSIGFSVTPDYTNDRWNYFDTYERGEDIVRYSVFEGNVFNSNPSTSGLAMNLNYSITNIFEAKYRSRRDTTKNKDKIIRFFESIRVSGSYNFAADSLKFTPINMSGNAYFFNRITAVNVNAGFDPYITNENGQRINTYRWSVDKKPLRFNNFSATARSQIKWAQIKKWLGLESNSSSESSSDRGGGGNPRGGNPRGGIGNPRTDSGNGISETSFLGDLSLSHEFGINITDRDGFEISRNSIGLSGTVNLSPKWKLTIRNLNYNFVAKGLGYPDIEFYRDLHCWEMGMRWQPEGGTYGFFLRVKRPPLDFLNIPYGQSKFDTNSFR